MRRLAVLACIGWPLALHAAPAACPGGGAACCPAGREVTVPSTWGLKPAEAIAAMQAVKLRPLVVRRPPDGTPEGRVMASNPYARLQVCTGLRVLLYVAHGEPPRLRNFRGDSLDEARERLRGLPHARMALRACGQPLEDGFDDRTRQLAVVDQSPGEGTMVLPSMPAGYLELAPRDDFWLALAGMSLQEARRRLAADPALRGWVLVLPKGRGASAAHKPDAARVLAAAGERSSCRVRVQLAPLDGPSPEPADREAEPPPPRTAPTLPQAAALGGGALGGVLLARLLMARRETAAGEADDPGASASPADRARQLVVYRTDDA